MNKPSELAEQELLYLQDTNFLTAKLRIQKKMQALLERTQKSLQALPQSLSFPEQVWEVPPKISRGENYKGLPYLVLDYPRVFQQESQFAYRTMLWWGHGFSCTLQLGGSYWQQYQSAILGKLKALQAQQWWLCVNDTPWEYHYEADNYMPLEDLLVQEKLQLLAQKPFFKISRRLPLREYRQLPSFSLETLQQLSLLFRLNP